LYPLYTTWHRAMGTICISPDDNLLVQAFLEQNTIGWDHLLRGRLS